MEVLGINLIASAAHNDLVARGTNTLGWLQDTDQERVMSRWGAVYRDVIILDVFNRPIARDNLTTHNLESTINRAALQNALLAAATPKDTDADKLPDEWETGWFGNLSAAPDGDDDGDGAGNLAEFAFATNPKSAASHPSIVPQVSLVGGKPALTARFRRYAGGSVRFVVETSPDLATWTADPKSVFQVGAMRMLYDGIGGAEVVFMQSTSLGNLPSGFLRITPRVTAGN